VWNWKSKFHECLRNESAERPCELELRAKHLRIVMCSKSSMGMKSIASECRRNVLDGMLKVEPDKAEF